LNEVILGAAIAILGTDATFGIAFITKICNMFEICISLRKDLLNRKFLSKMNDAKNTEAKIDSFLPLFKEHEKIENWKNLTSQIYENLSFSVILAVIGLSLHILEVNITFAQVPIEVLLIILGGFFALWVILQILSLAKAMHKWKQTKNIQIER
jgi:hypothetical protein